MTQSAIANLSNFSKDFVAVKLVAAQGKATRTYSKVKEQGTIERGNLASGFYTLILKSKHEMLPHNLLIR